MFAHPFRFRPSRRISLVPDESDESDAQEIAILLLTRREERPLAPEYGTLDPTFNTAGVDTGDIAASIAAFGPAVDVSEVTETLAGDGTSAVQITFSR